MFPSVRKVLTVLAALLALLAVPARPAPLPPEACAGSRLRAGGAPQEESEPEVELELLADTAHPAPGAQFQAGVLLRLPEHWHVYWQNPGDSGLATEVSVTAPAGFRVGRPVFPGPRRIELPGGLVSYGYERELLVVVPITAPRDLDPDRSIELSASARWLVCREGCYLQHGTARLTLPPAGGARSAESDPDGVFARWRERLPRPAQELPELEASWSGENPRPSLVLAVPGATDLELFPLAQDTMELVRQARRQRSAGAALELALDARAWGQEPAPDTLRGLLRVTRGGRSRYYELALRRPSAQGPGRPETPPREHGGTR